MMFLLGFKFYGTITTELQKQSAQNPNSTIWDVFLNSASFRNIFVSVVSTYGVYFLASFLHGEPFHMFTSFLQYMLLLPSFINILSIYAFCNTHDISWGTKGDNNATSLGGAKKVAGADQVEVELPFLDNKDKSSLNQDYVNWMRELSRRVKPEPPKRDLNTKLNDWYRSFRTRLVLTWMFSNAALIVVLTEPRVFAVIGDGYLTFVFWSFCAMSLVRFIGTLMYLFGYWGATVSGCRCC
jgi:chitin synthase